MGCDDAKRRSREPPVCRAIELPRGKAAPLQVPGVVRINLNSCPFAVVKRCRTETDLAHPERSRL
jgi:hypothetical protein